MNGSRSVIALAIALTIGLCSVLALPAYSIDVGRYGMVKTAEPEHQARGFVIFFSGHDGLTASDDAAARAIAGVGALVAEVNTPAYLRRLDKTDEKCHRLVGDMELLSRELQREHGFPNYFTPILAGVGEGGTLAAMALTEAPAATIAGVVSFDPSATVTSRRPICTSASVQARAAGFSYGAKKHLPGFWAVAVTPGVAEADRDYVMALSRNGAPLQLQQLGPNRNMGDALRTLIEPQLAKPATGPATSISALPLTILGVGHPSEVMAVVISGDGGWRDLDKTIAENLQRDGVPVVGWDSLRYFWSRKTPQQTASDLAAVLRTFMARWHASEVALIGYSFGADVMPFAYNRLPDSLRSHVALIALLGFSKTADFQITLTGWLGEPPQLDTLAVFPEVDKIPSRLMQCFYGQDEKDSACPDLARHGVEVIRTTGGHHFDGDYNALARRILAGFERRVGPLPLPAAVRRRSMASWRASLSTELDWALSLAAIVMAMLALLLWIVLRDKHSEPRPQ